MIYWLRIRVMLAGIICTAPIWMPLPSYSRQVGSPAEGVKAEKIFVIGSGQDEDLYKPKSLAVDSNGKIYVLDSGNSRIRVFSPEGKHEFSFGRFGQGPGELSMEATRIRILEDGNIYVIDNRQKRISVFTTQGEFLKSFTTRGYYHDILHANGMYFLSSLILARNYKPIMVTNDLTRLEESFGAIIEPNPGIIDIISKAPPPNDQILQNEFLLIDNFTSLCSDEKGNIYYSQNNPYHIIKYNRGLSKSGEVIGNPEFDTHFPLRIEFFGQGLSGVNKRVLSPPARVFDLAMVENGRFYVPVLSPDKSIILLDLYDEDCRLISRHKLDNIMLEPGKREGIAALVIDKKRNLYCLVVSAEEFPRLHKYKLAF